MPPPSCPRWPPPRTRAPRPSSARAPSCRPAPRCARASSARCGLPSATSGTRRRTGGTSATACPALRPSAVRTLCRMLSRDISGSSTFRGSSWRAKAAGRARSATPSSGPRSSAPARCGSTCHRSDGAIDAGHPARHLVDPRMRHHPREHAERQLLDAVLPFARLALLDVAAQFQQHLRNIDLDRADFAARAAQAGRERQRRARATRP